MSKKLLVSILALVMVVSLVPITAFAQEFADMPNDWSTEALEKAAENGLLQGYDGKIWPSKNLTRAEMATVINRSFGSYVEASLTTFDDMDEAKWYYSEMAKAVQMKTFKGDGKNLNPENNITREEAFVVLARALKLEPTSNKPLGFTDLSDISTWATGEIYAMVNAGYVSGSFGKLNPKANITRAEFAKVMDNVIKQYIVEEGIVSEVADGNIMVNVAGVQLNDVTITGDLIVGEGVGEGDLTLNNTIIEGRLVVRGEGENSIIIKGSSDVSSIVVARIDGVVRVFNESGNIIGEVIVDGSEDVILEGDFVDVTILASDVDVYAVNSNVDSLTIKGESSNLIVGVNSTVTNVAIEANGVNIEGEGTVENVEVKDGGENATITTTNTVIVVSEGVENVKGTGNVLVEPGVEYQNGETSTTPAEPVEEVITPPIIVGPIIPSPAAPRFVSANIYYDEGYKEADETNLVDNKLTFRVDLDSSITKLDAVFNENVKLNKLVIKNYDEFGDITVIDGGLLLGEFTAEEGDFSVYYDSLGNTTFKTTISLNIAGGKPLTQARIDEWSHETNQVEIEATVVDQNDGLTTTIGVILEPNYPTK